MPNNEPAVRIYTAGPMADYEKLNRLPAPWRADLEARIRRARPDDDLIFLHPEVHDCGHGGINPRQVVSGDFGLIQDADLVLAFLPRLHLVGTAVEVGFALANEVPVLLAECTEQPWIDVHESGRGCECGGDEPSAYWFARYASPAAVVARSPEAALAWLTGTACAFISGGLQAVWEARS